jgi:hypothetical protein
MSPTPPQSAAQRTGWTTPYSYSMLRLKRDWDLLHGHDHVVGEDPADSWLVLALRAVHWFGNAISPWEWLNYALVKRFRGASLLRSKGTIKARYWIGDLYVITTTFITILVARWAGRVGPHTLANALILVWIVWRLFEIWRTMLRFVVIDYIGDGYPHTTISAIRYLIYIPLYATQIVLIFAVIYLLWTPGGFIGGGLPALNGIDAYGYVSLTTISTLGSGYTAATHAARAWVVIESISGLVLFGLGISTFLGGLRLRGGRHKVE